MKWVGRFSGYSAHAFRKDLVSGCIVGIVAIPLGMAFAIASGVRPEYGLYTTIIAGILISLLGGSKFQIGGPTGAFIPVLLAVVMQYGYENLLVAGFLAGVFLVLMGLLRLGSLIKFIPKPVTIGFTSGIAVIIFSGQIANFLGLEEVERHEYFFYNMKEIFLRISSLNLYSVLIAGICLAALILTPKILPKVPGSLVGIIASTLIAAWLFPGKLTTIGAAYGPIPAELPSFAPLDFTWDRILLMLQPALIIAMLGSIESLLSAVVADEMTGTRHNSNRELIGQGVANMAAPLFGGIPATGAIARTATNIKSGAASPLSGVIHGIVVLLIVVLFAPYASSIPLASMAPILMVVAWNMSEYKNFTHMLKMRTGDSLILLVTFVLTVFTTLTVAVQAGLALAVILFLKRMSGIVAVNKMLPDHTSGKEKVQAHMVTEERNCPQLGIYTIEGTLFFGATHVLENLEEKLLGDPDLRVVLLRMGRVPFMDTTAEANFISLIQRLMQRGVIVLISGIKPQPKELLVKTGGYALIGDSRCFEHTGEALNYALEHLQFHKCLGCKQFAFRECTTLSSTGSLRQHIS
ncbi:SulP family inorganic anion transporter [Paenibacillus woosongensis]|uniref:STAS domain-containing protein n=1 Tax=Paenibacillus woosongensis TaxID=307580 RepID=A0A7X2Z2N8_9BACL|nr:SulP family inorganic anion transporter [Paenibacillus woosongensis]MUG46428.1 STAS domain-containing protein [Paenibacillus woosongensis]